MTNENKNLIKIREIQVNKHKKIVIHPSDISQLLSCYSPYTMSSGLKG